jgi:hypothetical protein
MYNMKLYKLIQSIYLGAWQQLENWLQASTKIENKIKFNKKQLQTKRWYKEREQLFLRKLTDISKPNTICIKDVYAPNNNNNNNNNKIQYDQQNKKWAAFTYIYKETK